jgi:hypothetical protein
MAYVPLRRGAGRLFDENLNRMLKELYAGMNVTQAEAVVLSTYGDTVSVERKAKNLSKFGINFTVGTTFETVGQFQGTTANETFTSTNSIDRVSSDNTSNNGLVVQIEGHTIDGSGNLTFVVQEATLGTPATTPVTLPTPLARASRMFPKASGTFNAPQGDVVGNVYVFDNTAATGTTAGVPDVAAATKLMLVDENQSQQCATSISSTDYWFITSIDAGIGSAGGNAARVLVRLETRDVANGGVWRPLGRDLNIDIDQNGVQQEESPYLIVPKNHDVRVRALTDANTASVFAEIRGVLAKVI